MMTLAVVVFLTFFFFFLTLKIVPQQQAWIIERLGKFNQKREAGPFLRIPFVDKVAYKHSLKEEAIDIHEQTAITKDNVTIKIDGILYMKIIDPVSSSYGVFHPRYALTQLAQTTLRSEIGKIPLDRAFEEREHLNEQVVRVLNEAAHSWGIECKRYEIKDIIMPDDVRRAMELQVTADRQKRARILESEGMRQAEINSSEGKRQAEINVAEGCKQRMVLESEGEKTEKINHAAGEAQALQLIAQATALALHNVGEALKKEGGEEAAALKVAEEYIAAFRELAKESTTVLLPANPADASSLAAQALTIFEKIKTRVPKLPPVASLR